MDGIEASNGVALSELASAVSENREDVTKNERRSIPIELRNSLAQPGAIQPALGLPSCHCRMRIRVANHGDRHKILVLDGSTREIAMVCVGVELHHAAPVQVTSHLLAAIFDDVIRHRATLATQEGWILAAARSRTRRRQ